MPRSRAAEGLLAALLAGAATASPAPPHLDVRGLAAYQEYLAAESHKAFALAPGGRWAWRSGEPSPEMAEQEAVAACNARSDLACIAYALDDRVVFDEARWARLWGGYIDAEDAAARPPGQRRGERLPDLAFTDPAGRAGSLRERDGRVRILHFWGSWCPPCVHEIPDLARFHGIVRREFGGEAELILLQMREPAATARGWLKERGFAGLPAFDSGATGPETDWIGLGGGGRLPDREIAGRFPTTYVLDRHGVVLFRHVGPIARWEEYLPFLRDAVERAPR